MTSLWINWKGKIFQSAICILQLAIFTLLSPLLSYAASDYGGKTVTVVVGYPPGGGYDRYARLYAKYLPKYIPGSPTVVVQNMPGGGSIIAANHLYSVAKPDGLTFGTFNNALVLAQLTKVEGARFDLTKFAWIGSMARDATVLAVRTDLPYKTVDELRKAKEPVIFGATGVADTSYVVPFFLKEFAGFNFKMVTGYSGSAAIMLAVERKEADGRAGSYASLKPFVDRGLVRPLIRARVSVPEIKALPVDEDLATTAKGKAMMAIRSAPTAIYRPYVAPPGTPSEAMKILRDAFSRASQDKELLAEATKANLPIDYESAEDSLKIIREVLNQPPDTVQEITKYLKFGD